MSKADHPWHPDPTPAEQAAMTAQIRRGASAGPTDRDSRPSGPGPDLQEACRRLLAEWRAMRRRDRWKGGMSRV